MVGVQRMTKKAWFGPKSTVGWGWRPVAREGWLATVVFIVALTVALETLTGVARIIGGVVILLAFGALVLFTGDPPGGPS
jgi:hypothetical protein